MSKYKINMTEDTVSPNEVAFHILSVSLEEDFLVSIDNQS